MQDVAVMLGLIVSVIIIFETFRSIVRRLKKKPRSRVEEPAIPAIVERRIGNKVYGFRGNTSTEVYIHDFSHVVS